MDALTQQEITALRERMEADRTLTAARIAALEAQIAAYDKLYAERLDASHRQRAEAIEAMKAKIDANDIRYREQAKIYVEERQLALQAMEKRLDGMNEFRATITDITRTMVPRSEFEAIRENMLERIEQVRPGLEERVAQHGQQMLIMVPRREFDDARNVILDKFEEHRKTSEAQLSSAVEPLRLKVEQHSQPNWALMASALSILMVIISAAWLVTGLKIDGAISPVALSLEQTKVQQAAMIERVRIIDTSAQASAQADQVSKSDRAQLSDRLRSVESTQAARASTIADVVGMKMQMQQMYDRSSENRSEITRQEAALVEIETQFCAADIMRNLMHAQDMRIQSMLWDKSFDNGIRMPTDNAYYPVICNRASTVGTGSNSSNK